MENQQQEQQQQQEQEEVEEMEEEEVYENERPSKCLELINVRSRLYKNGVDHITREYRVVDASANKENIAPLGGLSDQTREVNGCARDDEDLVITIRGNMSEIEELVKSAFVYTDKDVPSSELVLRVEYSNENKFKFASPNAKMMMAHALQSLEISSSGPLVFYSSIVGRNILVTTSDGAIINHFRGKLVSVSRQGEETLLTVCVHWRSSKSTDNPTETFSETYGGNTIIANFELSDVTSLELLDSNGDSMPHSIHEGDEKSAECNIHINKKVLNVDDYVVVAYTQYRAGWKTLYNLCIDLDVISPEGNGIARLEHNVVVDCPGDSSDIKCDTMQLAHEYPLSYRVTDMIKPLEYRRVSTTLENTRESINSLVEPTVTHAISYPRGELQAQSSRSFNSGNRRRSSRKAQYNFSNGEDDDDNGNDSDSDGDDNYTNDGGEKNRGPLGLRAIDIGAQHIKSGASRKIPVETKMDMKYSTRNIYNPQKWRNDGYPVINLSLETGKNECYESGYVSVYWYSGKGGGFIGECKFNSMSEQDTQHFPIMINDTIRVNHRIVETMSTIGKREPDQYYGNDPSIPRDSYTELIINSGDLSIKRTNVKRRYHFYTVNSLQRDPFGKENTMVSIETNLKIANTDNEIMGEMYNQEKQVIRNSYRVDTDLMKRLTPNKVHLEKWYLHNDDSHVCVDAKIVSGVASIIIPERRKGASTHSKLREMGEIELLEMSHFLQRSISLIKGGDSSLPTFVAWLAQQVERLVELTRLDTEISEAIEEIKGEIARIKRGRADTLLIETTRELRELNTKLEVLNFKLKKNKGKIDDITAEITLRIDGHGGKEKGFVVVNIG